jgi:flagellar biosynthesis anti-sigma factor FlgM
MRIPNDGQGRQVALEPRVGGAEKVREANVAAAGQPTSQDSAVRVTISAKAMALASTQSKDEIDEAKVERLRDDIESGRFTVDSHELAHAIIDKEG